MNYLNIKLRMKNVKCNKDFDIFWALAIGKGYERLMASVYRNLNIFKNRIFTVCTKKYKFTKSYEILNLNCSDSIGPNIDSVTIVNKCYSHLKNKIYIVIITGRHGSRNE